MGTGASLTAPERVRRLQTVHHEKAKEAPGYRFHTLKVWRDDVLAVAWDEVRRNGGVPGVDGETIADIEAGGVERWLGELALELKEGTYRPQAVRRVRIAKKQRGQFRPLGIPCVRDRVAQTAVLLVLSPMVEADLAAEQYAYRPGRSAHEAVNRVHGLVNTGHREVVDADLSDDFGQIPHVELLKCLARRVSDGRMLGWVKAWLEMAVEEDDGRGGTRRTNQARRERKGTPLSHLYMRRFIPWAGRCWDMPNASGLPPRKRGAEIVNHADDIVVLGQGPVTPMRAAVEDVMKRLKLPLNTEKTRSVQVPQESFSFLGYRIGRNYRRDTGRAYIGTRPSQASVQSLCRRISELTSRRYGLLEPEGVVGRLNRLMTGWANYFLLGQVSPAYVAIDRHATRRLRQWLCRKHKVRTGRYVHFPDKCLWNEMGLTRLALRTTSYPWAKS